MSDFDRVRDLALELPEVEESVSWGTPSLKVRGRLFLRRHEDPGLTVVKISPQERAALTAARPEVFIVTPHYENHRYVLVRAAELTEEELRELVTEAWRLSAPQRLVKEFDRDAG
ncbi:MmcQ/YjbR family DNA-binding protein [Planomonospora sp. ID82291]|uniref:MmcQ/YjbR family DNA-binding protein n=1 Tax=Planomonospora sp. ID82291 TaxID=2738136 RepID=UPI0018C3D7E7|nr:MmcQ/YjbR family DNA-binding protein [Planomonospora sp. ID82291]MBG0815675.1 MmcQ/YjbR family DNA-binding protein [Planomonospora sp. ID82291]